MRSSVLPPQLASVAQLALATPDLDEATREEFLSQMREQVARLTKLIAKVCFLKDRVLRLQ